MKAKTHVVPNAQEGEDLLGEIVREINDGLNGLFSAEVPESLYAPGRFVLAAGGKRLRPALLMLTADALGVQRGAALPAALAVEVFHNFTLVHDDIMDHASERRGRPTVHTRWNESVAILTGDLMHAESYALLSQAPADVLPALLRSFHRMVVHLCEGQALDKEFERRREVSLHDYEEMIRRKTGALLGFVMEAPALLARLSGEQRSALRSAGTEIGVGFQVQDDLLDLTATSADWGKAIGGDLVEGKKTYILLRAIERTSGEDRRILTGVIETGGVHPDAVGGAIEIIRKSGALDDAARKVDAHYSAALAALDLLPGNEASKTLRDLISRLQHRSH